MATVRALTRSYPTSVMLPSQHLVGARVTADARTGYVVPFGAVRGVAVRLVAIHTSARVCEIEIDAVDVVRVPWLVVTGSGVAGGAAVAANIASAFAQPVASPQALMSGEYVLVPAPRPVAPRDSNGSLCCTTCREPYPYAEPAPDGSFVCRSCESYEEMVKE